VNHLLSVRQVVRSFFPLMLISFIVAGYFEGRASASQSCVVNPKFIEAQNAYQQIPPDQIDPELASTWSGLVARQHDLMNQACQQIDPACGQVDSMVNALKSQCHGELPPDEYQSCVSQQQQVQSAIDACKSVAGPYNAAVESWVADLDSFISRLNDATIANCQKRTSLISQWNTQKGDIAIDRQVLTNLKAEFEQHVSDVESVGVHLTEFHDDLDRIDELLDHLSSKPLENVSEEELTLITKGLEAWASDIANTIAAVRIHSKTEAEVGQLQDMKSRTDQLQAHVSGLEQVKQQFDHTGLCNSTSLVGQ
jgi:hypothetical protein